MTRDQWKAEIDAQHRRWQEMKAERMVIWSATRRRWCLCNGFAKILADFATQEDAEAHRHQHLVAEQLPLL